METAGPPPTLSVLIASHNRRELLRRCLDSLRNQTQDPRTFEVVVADDGSTDGTGEMAAALDASFPLRLLRLEQAGKYVAVNTAVEAARGSACLILDDDVIASPELVAAHVAAHRADPMALGLGALTQEPPAGRDWYARAFARAWAEHYTEFEQRAADWSDCYGANFSAPRSALLEVGGFATDLTIAGDLDIGFRLQQAGCVPTYLPNAHGVHDDQKRARKMLDDARRQAAAHVELAERHPAAAPRLLNWTGWAGPKELQARRLLIALRLPPGPLVAMGNLIPGSGRRMLWFHFVSRFAFWRSVRSRVDDRRWARLTRDGPPGPEDRTVAQRVP